MLLLLLLLLSVCCLFVYIYLLYVILHRSCRSIYPPLKKNHQPIEPFNQPTNQPTKNKTVHPSIHLSIHLQSTKNSLPLLWFWYDDDDYVLCMSYVCVCVFWACDLSLINSKWCMVYIDVKKGAFHIFITTYFFYTWL